MKIAWRKQLLQYSIFISVISLVLFKKTGNELSLYLWPLLIVVGALFKPVSDWTVKVLDKVVSFVFKALSTLTLMIIFFLILTPLALLRRIIKREDVLWVNCPDKKSFWKECDPVTDKQYFEDMF